MSKNPLCKKTSSIFSWGSSSGCIWRRASVLVINSYLITKAEVIIGEYNENHRNWKCQGKIGIKITLFSICIGICQTTKLKAFPMICSPKPVDFKNCKYNLRHANLMPYFLDLGSTMQFHKKWKIQIWETNFKIDAIYSSIKYD